MALGLKQYGRIGFVRSRKARAVTGYGTVGADGSFLNSFRVRIVKYLKGMGSYFTKRIVTGTTSRTLSAERLDGEPNYSGFDRL